MEEQCSLCRIAFDQRDHYPMILCQQQHLCCSNCLKNLFARNPSCPECRQILSRETVIRFRLYFACNDKIKMKQKAFEKEYKQIVITDIHFGKKLINGQKLYQSVKEKAVALIRLKRYQIAAEYLQNAIQQYLENKGQVQEILLGMGSKEEERNYFKELSIDQWIDKHGLSNISLCDLLSFAYLRSFQKKYEEKKQWCLKMIKKYPQNYKIMFVLGLVEHNHQQLQLALNLFLKINSLKPQLDKPYQMIAMIYLEKKSYKLAKDYSEKCIQKNIFAKCIRIESFRQKKDTVKVFQTLNSILISEPNFIRALYLKGLCLVDEQKYTSAKLVFEDCFKINSRFMLSYIKIAEMDYILCHDEDAIKNLKYSLTQPLSKSQREQALFLLVRLYSCIEDLENTTKFTMKLLQLFPENNFCFLYLGNVYFAKSMYNEALNAYKKYSENFYNERVYQNILSSYNALSKYQEMLIWLQRWSKKQPEKAGIILTFADTYFNLKRLNEAYDCYQRCLNKQHEQRYCFAKMIQIHRQKGENKEAIKKLGEFIIRCELTVSEVQSLLAFGENLTKISSKKVKL